MSDIHIRKVGRTGRITLKRPEALNALTLDMLREIGAILPIWAADDDISMLVVDAEGDKAFCAGGDIAEIYAAMKSGNYDLPREFWREEYPVNLALFNFPKPIASFLQGFTMGGGVGVGCHASHRIVCENSQIAMPECSIGLVPDVGGSLLLARAPGRLGEYLGMTSTRMGPGDAIFAGFADYFIPNSDWADLIIDLEETGDWGRIDCAAYQVPESPLAADRSLIDSHFSGETHRDITNDLGLAADWGTKTLEKIARNAPLATAATPELIHRARARDNIAEALRNEYRFGHRIAAQGDFQEGIRAAIIDRDRNPQWSHKNLADVALMEVSQMLLPLGADELVLT